MRNSILPASIPSGPDPLENLYRLNSAAAGLSVGVQGAHEGADHDWRATAWHVLRDLAQGGDTFTVDTLRRHGVPDPRKHQHWGAVFAVASKLNLIDNAGFTSHAQPKGAVTPLRVWRGTKKAHRATAWATTPAADPNAGKQR